MLEGSVPWEGPVVQWSERAAHNGVVAGSNPAGPTTFPPENLPVRGIGQKPQRSADFAAFCVGAETAGTELLEAN